MRQPPGGPLPLHEVPHSDPYGEDLQLALYACYELHYRGFSGVDAGWEWDPELLRLRAAMESVFHEALRADVVEAAAAPTTSIASWTPSSPSLGNRAASPSS